MEPRYILVRANAILGIPVAAATIHGQTISRVGSCVTVDPNSLKSEFSFPVEHGHIQQFCRALGWPDDIADGDGGSSPLVAPPTFLMAADHFDPEFERRPQPGRPWYSHSEVAGVGKSPNPVFHVEQHFTYRRPIVAGEVLLGRRQPGRRWTKQGRKGGRLEFIETITQVLDPDGLPVVTASWVDVRTERSHAELSVSESAQSGPVTNPPTVDRASSADPRHCRTLVVAEFLTRTHFVMYAGASGDFHPLHHDENYARTHGYPSVFAPGMLTMGMTARVLSEFANIQDLLQFGGRFRGQVWPGDTLTSTAILETEPDDSAPREIALVTTNQDGSVVFEGRAFAKRTTA